MNSLILVQVWCEIDPTLNLRIDRGTDRPVAEAGDALARVSPLGRSGVDAALGLSGFEVVAFAVGGGHENALRHALASGAARAVQLGDEGLSGWVKAQDPALVIGDRTAGLMAGALGWAHLAGLEALRVAAGRLPAIRRMGRGDREEVSAILPAVVRLAEETVRLRYVSQDRLRAAMGREIERVALEEDAGAQAEAGTLQLARPRTRLGAAAPPASGMDRMKALMGVGQAPATPAARPSESASQTPDEMAEAFVRYLRHIEQRETSPTPLPSAQPVAPVEVATLSLSPTGEGEGE